jgi:peroxiredoxin Q/BCP
MKVQLALLIAASFAVLAFAATGGAGAEDLNAGDAAPPFSLPGSDGKTHTLADYRGKTVVLAWFPKAFTGG